MSIKAVHTWAAQPSTTRGQPTQLAVDPKGERIAYASNKSIFLRSIDDPSHSTQYTSHTATATVARFSPSGYYVASGDESGTVKVWDCTGSGVTKGEYHIISGRINDLAWDGDSQRLIAVGHGKEKFGHCITADSGNSVGEIKGHTEQINCVGIRQQRPLRAATAGDDMSTVFYHGAPFKFNTSLKRHQRYVYGLGFSPDGSTLVSVGADRKIFLYDGKTGEAKAEIGDGEHKGSIFGVSWSRDSKRVATCSADQTVKVWDLEAGKAVQSWRLGSEEGVVSIPDHQVGVVWPPGRSDDLIISLALSSDLNYLSPTSSKPVRVVQGHQKNITNLTSSLSSDDSPTLFTGSSDGRICSWATTSGTASTTSDSGHTNYISGLASSPGRIFSVAWDDTLRSIDADTNCFTGSTKTDGQPRSIATISAYTIIATHKGLALHSQSDSSIIKSLPTPSSSPTAIAATETHAAVSSDDSILRLYSLPDLELKHTFPAFPSQISCLSFSSFVIQPPSNDKKPYLAIGFTSGRILVYSPVNHFAEPVISRWSAHTGRVTSIAWDSKAARAVSGGLDTNIFVWSVKKPGGRVSVGSAHKEGVNGVAWLDEGKVVSAGGDGAAKVWAVEGVE